MLLRKLYLSNFKFGVSWSLSRNTVGAGSSPLFGAGRRGVGSMLLAGSYSWEVQALDSYTLGQFPTRVFWGLTQTVFKQSRSRSPSAFPIETSRRRVDYPNPTSLGRCPVVCGPVEPSSDLSSDDNPSSF